MARGCFMIAAIHRGQPGNHFVVLLLGSVPVAAHERGISSVRSLDTVISSAKCYVPLFLAVEPPRMNFDLFP